MSKLVRIVLIVLASQLLSTNAFAQRVLESYVAYIGRDDLYNSSGVRLTEPWQILRQDRANYHRFGIRQLGDEGDGFFGSIDNRARMERMIMNGVIAPSAASSIVSGGATVRVTLYRSGGRDWVEVDVWSSPGTGPATATVLDRYVAFIGRDDLYNSSGVRLTEPWQILRQDRANYHRFGVRQRGDQGDSFFGAIDNRARMERMIMNGSVEPRAAQSIVGGGSTVVVTIYRSGGQDWIDVEVWN